MVVSAGALLAAGTCLCLLHILPGSTQRVHISSSSQSEGGKGGEHWQNSESSQNSTQHRQRLQRHSARSAWVCSPSFAVGTAVPASRARFLLQEHPEKRGMGHVKLCGDPFPPILLGFGF